MPQLSRNIGCREVVEHLEAWVDGDVQNALADDMNRHIQSCPRCRTEYELAEQVRSGLRRLPTFDLPPEVLHQVGLKTAGASGSSRAGGWFPPVVFRPAAAAAAVGSMALVVGVVVTQMRAPEPQPTAAEVETVSAQTRLALECLGDVIRRAEAGVAARIVDERAVASTIGNITKNLSRSLGDEEGPTTDEKNEGSL